MCVSSLEKILEGMKLLDIAIYESLFPEKELLTELETIGGYDKRLTDLRLHAKTY